MPLTSPRIVLLLAALGACTADAAEVASSEQAVAVTWQNAVGVSAVGNDLTKTAAQSTWAAGASSIETISGDGFARFTTAEATTAKMVGLNVGDVNRGYAEIDFALYLTAAGKLYVYESGTNRGLVGTYVAGDTLQVQVGGGSVTYLKNGGVVYTSTVAPAFPLRVDTSLYTPGATVQDVELVSFAVSWKNAVGVAAAGNSLTKTAAQDTWAAGASSIESLSGDGAVELSTSEATTAKMAGLSVGDANRGFTEIDYAIYLTQLGKVYVYENGVSRGVFGTYAAGDTFRIEVAGAAVTYRKNGALLYTSTVAPSFPLGVDTSLKTPGATINAVKLTPGAQVCPAYAGAGPVCVGSYALANAGDVAAVTGCARITGDLSINGAGLTDVTLPNLQRVDGQLSGLSSTSSLRLPALREIGGQLYLPFPIASIDLSRLHGASSLNVGDLSVPCLETASSFISAGDLDAPRLRTVGISLLVATASVPELETVGGDVTGAVNAPILTSIGGALEYTDSVSVPAIEQTGGLHLVRTIPIDLPVLTEARQIVAGAFATNLEDCTATLQVDLELPALQRAATLSVCVSTQIQLPALTELTGPPYPILRIGRDPALQPVTLPALTTIAGDLDAYVPLDLPALQSVAGQVVVDATVAAPALTSIGGRLWLRRPGFSADDLTTIAGVLKLDGGAPGPVALPGVTSVGGILGRWSGPPSLSLPALTTVTDDSSTQYSGDVWIRGTTMTSLALPLLGSIAGELHVESNSVMTSIDLSALTALGPILMFENNAALPSCYPTNLRDQLIAAGWVGTATIGGNTGTGGCP